jgi:DNA-binding NtrC family response regulator
LTSKPPAHDAFLTTEEVLERHGRRRLWLVDDDEGTRVLLTKMLERDYDVETTVDGSSALDALRTGYSTEKSAIDAVNLRVAGYLTKPLRDSQVLEAAARALGEPAA